jgi:ribosome biogenesis protein YTM1
MAMYSGSWDHTLRMWDTQAGVNSSTWNTGRPINSLDFSEDFNLMAPGHDDRIVRTWDLRQSGKEALKVSLKDHEGWVSCVKWVRVGDEDTKVSQDESSPPSPSSFTASGARAQLATCSYDGTVKIWDLRASAPLFTSQTQAKGGSAAKFLSVDWANPKTLVAAGEKGRLDVIELQ